MPNPSARKIDHLGHDFHWSADKTYKCTKCACSYDRFRHGRLSCGEVPRDPGDAKFSLTPYGQAVAEEWLPYAISVARDFVRGTTLDWLEAESAAQVGLINLVARHNPRRSGPEKMKAYIRIGIKRAMIDWRRIRYGLNYFRSGSKERRRPRLISCSTGTRQAPMTGIESKLANKEDPNPTAYAAAASRETVDYLLGFDPLPGPVLPLAYRHGYNDKQIAEELGISPSYANRLRLDGIDRIRAAVRGRELASDLVETHSRL